MKNNIVKNEEFDLWVLMLRTHKLITQLRELELAQYNILTAQSYILFVIHALGDETTPSKISRFVYQQRNSISGILNRMEQNGIITKTKGTDGKNRIIVKITQKGHQALQQSLKRESIRSVIAVLPKEKRQQLQSCLELLRDKAIKDLAFKNAKLLPPSQILKSQFGQNIDG